jgi:hypothetical protein
MRRCWVPGAALVLSGCTTLLPARWPGGEWLHPKGQAFPDAAAVDLYRADRLLVFTSQKGVTAFQHSEAILIQSEAGRDLATVRVPFGGGVMLTELRARRIDPDGTITVVPQDRMLEQKASTPGAEVDVRVLQFPDVRVGSIVEYVATLQAPVMVPYHAQLMLGPLNTLHYEAEITTDEHVVRDVRAYHFPTQLHENVSGAVTRVWFTAENLPAHRAEEWAPSPTLDEPWWAFGITQLVNGTRRIDVLSEWSTALRGWARAMDSPKLNAGLESHLSGRACSAKACMVDLAVDFVRSRTDFAGYGSFEGVRPLKQVLDSHQASGFEKALLLRRLLVNSGVKAQVAASARVLTRLVDMHFPSASYWNHLLVFVPQQPGISAALWIDPSCEYCRAGELPDETRGVDAVVLYPPLFSVAQAVVATTFGKMPAVADETETLFDATLDDTGRLGVRAHTTLRGGLARDVRTSRAGSTEGTGQQQAEGLVHGWAAAAQMQAFKLDACDKVKGECDDELSFFIPSYAARDGARWIVPLTVLSRAGDALLATGQRTRDIAVARALRIEETARIRVPEGYEVVELPVGSSESTEAMEMAFGAAREAGGVVVHRSAQMRIGLYGKEDFPALKKVLETYREWREKTIVLERRVR